MLSLGGGLEATDRKVELAIAGKWVHMVLYDRNAGLGAVLELLAAETSKLLKKLTRNAARAIALDERRQQDWQDVPAAVYAVDVALYVENTVAVAVAQSQTTRIVALLMLVPLPLPTPFLSLRMWAMGQRDSAPRIERLVLVSRDRAVDVAE
jgi:hypothetical protein